MKLNKNLIISILIIFGILAYFNLGRRNLLEGFSNSPSPGPSDMSTLNNNLDRLVSISDT